MIYVDELYAWPGKPQPGAERTFGNGKQSCHLYTDSADLEELHAFAERLGLRRAWFQPKPQVYYCHYDLTPNKRAQAVRLGAVEVRRMEWARRWQKSKEEEHGTND